MRKRRMGVLSSLLACSIGWLDSRAQASSWMWECRSSSDIVSSLVDVYSRELSLVCSAVI